MAEEESGTVADESTGEVEEQATGGEQGQEGEESPKTFTQAEVDAIAAKAKRKLERKLRRELESEYAARLPVEQPKIELKPPAREDFKSDAEYEEARLDYKIELKEAKREAERARQSMQEADKAFSRSVEDFLDSAEDLPGFDREGFQSRFGYGYSNEFVKALVESPKAAELAEYLCINEAEADKLDGMSEARRIAYLGTIEAKLVRQAKPATDQPPQVKGGQTSSTLYKTSPDKLNDDQWYRERQAERAKQYGR